MKNRPVVTHLCCLDGPDPILVAVIWGKIFWRPLRAGWLASKWVALALPGEDAVMGARMEPFMGTKKPATKRRDSSFETGKTARKRGRVSK